MNFLKKYEIDVITLVKHINFISTLVYTRSICASGFVQHFLGNELKPQKVGDNFLHTGPVLGFAGPVARCVCVGKYRGV